MNYKVYESADEVVKAIADRMLALSLEGRKMHISLSGGSTPKLLFKRLASSPFKSAVIWKNLHFWWGDERCVDPADAESNYGEANELLFKRIDIPERNIHRILGENDPNQEATRFSDELMANVPLNNGVPMFDWILLGMGEDGHTASLFPNRTDYSERGLAIVASHPESGQLRVSKSARLIENAKCISYLVLGENKAKVIKDIEQTPAGELEYPAAKIKSAQGKTEWLLDIQAAKLLAKGE